MCLDQCGDFDTYLVTNQVVNTVKSKLSVNEYKK